MSNNQRSVELQNVYARRVICMVLMGIANSKSSYTDRFIYSLFHTKNCVWDENDVSWTAFFCEMLNEISDEIKNGAYWKTGAFFSLIAAEDRKFWESIDVPFKTWKDIEFS
ncbi:hypothetical protein POP12_107 [Pectobacterium phage POP12]|nr:hypothetical protein POP12_107 [Pectobacterium phage POP12]